MCQNMVVEKLEITCGVVWVHFRLRSSFRTCVVLHKLRGSVAGRSSFAVCAFVSIEFLRHFQHVTYNLHGYTVHQ